MIRPVHILGFLMAVLLLLAGLAMVFPEDGIKIGSVELKFPDLTSFFNPEKVEYADISDITKKQLKVDTSDATIADTTAIQDTIRADAEVLAASEYPIEYAKGAKQDMYAFFEKMEQARNINALRILHYGDSQIEADHISGFLRERLQQSFGGQGPGYLAVKPVTQKLSWRVHPDDAWKRYTLYGNVDSTITHQRYGHAMALFRYAPVWNDSLPEDTTEYTASFSVENSFQGYGRTNRWDKAKLFYGNLHRPVVISLYSMEDELIRQDSLMPTDNTQEYLLSDSLMDAFRVEMSGYDSPDVYAISLESNKGVVLDNLPLRGSAGTVFTAIEHGMILDWLNRLNAGMIIVQFGVNVVSDELDDFSYYQRWMAQQLKALQRMKPDMPVLVIGVSDMSKKERTKYVSYDAIEIIRDAQKKAATEAGVAFWDMYEAMGGENSMPSWVWADPPLANKDFTHFNVEGARIISNMLYNAIMLEYHIYRNQKVEKNETGEGA
ncbi:MAG: GDSL-type esterase/lipase family protein [Bacteroidales bacterium]